MAQSAEAEVLDEPVIVLDSEGSVIAEIYPVPQNGAYLDGAQSVTGSTFELEDHPVDITSNISVSFWR